MEKVKKSILVPLNNSRSSQAVIDYLLNISLCPEDWKIALYHLFRKPSESEELMGRKFTEAQPSRMMAVLEKAKDLLVERGFPPENIEIELIDELYPTVADGIIDQFNRHKFDMVVIGRKRMSKAEEFVMGDISVKLVRALEKAAVLVVKL